MWPDVNGNNEKMFFISKIEKFHNGGRGWN